MLSKVDSYLLSNASSCQIVVKTDTLLELGLQASNEVRRLYSNHLQDPTLNLFKLAGVGRRTDGIKDAKYRGDVRCWLSPSLCGTHQLTGVKALIAKIVKECEGSLKKQHNLNGHYSIQASLYPGDGAHYVRHLDAGTKAEATDQQQQQQSPENAMDLTHSSGMCPGKRRLTFIYYLNDPDTFASNMNVGGNLRVYNIPDTTTTGDAPSNQDPETFMDIAPVLGTLVVFRSDTVEHEVLPTYRDRWALTLWAYAHDDHDGPHQERVCPVPRAPVPATANLIGQLTSHTSNSPPPSSSTQVSPKPPPLHVPFVEEPARAEKWSIFVSIISYRDSELPHTVRDLFASAAHPERVFVGIVYQLHTSDEPLCRLRPEHLDEFAPSGRETGVEKRAFYAAHVRTLSLPHTEAKGPIFARHLAASLYAGEDFVLQIDSHMRFRGNWDAYLVALLRCVEVEQGTNKVVLSTYPLGYHLPDRIPQDTRPTVLMPSKFDEHGFLRQEGKVLDHTDTIDSTANSAGSSTVCSSSNTSTSRNSSNSVTYLRSALWAAGFSFARGALLLEVPYSPLLPHLFFGEEVSMAARLHTHGCDLFCPAEAVLYHLYSRQHRPTFQELQQPQQLSLAENVGRDGASSGIAALKRRSMRAVQHLLGSECAHVEGGGEGDGGAGEDSKLRNMFALNEKHFGLGTVRSLESFWAQLAQLGVSRPVPGANAHGTSQSGCVVRDDTKRLAFLKTDSTQGMLPFRFAQASAASTAPPPEGLSTALSGAEQLPQSDARLMALLSSTAGLGSRVQRFL